MCIRDRGVDSPQWTDEQLAEMARENAKGITYEGRHYTQYEATQQQKALENSIRQCKDHIAAAQEEGQLGSGCLLYTSGDKKKTG